MKKNIIRYVLLAGLGLLVTGCYAGAFNAYYKPATNLDDANLVYLKDGEEPELIEGNWETTEEDHQKILDQGYVMIGMLRMSEYDIQDWQFRGYAIEKRATLARRAIIGDWSYDYNKKNSGLLGALLYQAIDADHPDYQGDLRLYVKRRQ